ncbi:LysR family transcriptional regulator [Nitrogeniibacter mangrovi]|uniref:LysR family transcriptional regulator n=1 Tax=Nitrogeniibacter mangrovi TaxID=2016596 RepID=A0A6C1B8P4_9RHOO|nr:LysR family transcriptional regulator [Nitrogeniibacter mangrovi]QID19329.1 LysR family transcriptional regulator [Nitrogeniibacter mangrovi]
MRYDLTDLKLFVAVADAGNLSRGAAGCHLAPSSASHRIARLEEAFGTPMLIREARGVRLTAAGEVLRDGARHTLARLEQLHADLAPFASGVRGQVSVWANTNATNIFLPEDLADYLHDHPHVRVTLKEAASPDIVHAVAQGEAQIGVVASDVSTGALQVAPYRHDRLVLVVPPGDALGSRARVRFAEVVNAPFVALHAGTGIHTFLMNKATELGHHLDVRIQVHGFDAVIGMVAAGVGYALVPHSSVQRSRRPHQVVTLALEDDWARRDLRLLVRDAATLNAHARALFERLSRGVAHHSASR